MRNVNPQEQKNMKEIHELSRPLSQVDQIL